MKTQGQQLINNIPSKVAGFKPTTVAADSRILTVKSDKTDNRGVRHVVTSVTKDTKSDEDSQQ